jgi:SAM-dependent methyltransferase
MEIYKPSEYWQKRLSGRPNLMGTGHRQFSLEYNIKMYGVAAARLYQALATANVALPGQHVLEVGAGFGYWVERFLAWGAAHVTGTDLTDVAVAHLRQTFPDQTFWQADISDAGGASQTTFDLVAAISVIFHIVDASRFNQAVSRMCQHVRPGGHLIIVDAFCPHHRPLAAHARLRDLDAYQPILDQHRFEVCDIYPMYHLMSRTYIPILGPAVLSRQPFLDWLVRQELKAGADPQRKRGVLNYLIARRKT